MSDIVERLRKRADDKFIRDYPLLAEAADEIERLRAQGDVLFASIKSDAASERLRSVVGIAELEDDV